MVRVGEIPNACVCVLLLWFMWAALVFLVGCGWGKHVTHHHTTRYYTLSNKDDARTIQRGNKIASQRV